MSPVKPQLDHERPMSRSQIARIFEVTPDTITEWTRRGLRYSRPGGRRMYFFESDVRAFLAAHRDS